jgi:predicted transcriptional regulator
MMAMTLPKSTARILTELTGEPRVDVALLIVLKDNIRYKLERIETRVREYESKYGMPFDAYKRKWEVEDDPEHYSYEREMDYLEWEALVTRKERVERE